MPDLLPAGFFITVIYQMVVSSSNFTCQWESSQEWTASRRGGWEPTPVMCQCSGWEYHPSWHSGCSGCPVNTCTTNSLSLGLWTSFWGITIFTAELKPTNCVRAVWRAVMTASYVYHFSWYANWRELRSAGMAALMRTRMSLSKHLFIVGLEQVGDSQWGSSFDLFFGQTFWQWV